MTQAAQHTLRLQFLARVMHKESQHLATTDQSQFQEFACQTC